MAGGTTAAPDAGRASTRAVPSQRRVAGGAADPSGMRRNDAKQDKPSQTFPSYRVCSDHDKQGKRTKSRNNTKVAPNTRTSTRRVDEYSHPSASRPVRPVHIALTA